MQNSNDNSEYNSNLTKKINDKQFDMDMIDISDDNDAINNRKNEIPKNITSQSAQNENIDKLNNNSNKLNNNSNKSNENTLGNKNNLQNPNNKNKLQNNNKNNIPGDQNKDNKNQFGKDGKNNKDNKKPNQNQARDELKKNLEPIKDELKKKANKVVSKAAGTALSAYTGGLIPPKIGEKITEKAIPRLEKNVKRLTPTASLNKLGKNENKELKNEKKAERKEKIKEKGQKAVQTVSTTINAIKFVVFIKKYWPIIVGVLSAILIAGGFAIFISIIQTYLPGLFGDVKKEIEIENYSVRDRKILNEIETIVSKYPNADGAFVMATVSYPYYGLLQDESIMNQTKSELNEDEEEEEDYYDQMELLFEDDQNLGLMEKIQKYTLIGESLTEILGKLVGDEVKEFLNIQDDLEEEQSTQIENDMYLNIYAKKKYRDEFDKLMSIYNSSGVDGYKEYLKNTYFKEDKGYIDILENVTQEDLEDISIDMIVDINEVKDMFEKYIPEVQVCHSTLQSAGTVEVDDILKTGAENILVDVKEETCKAANSVDSCASWEGMPIPLKEYVKGVVNTEISINENTSMEKIKTQMIMAKSVVLGRYKEMGWEVKQNENGAYIIPIRANTNDQDYCDYKVGCSGKLSGNEHGPASEKVQEMLEQAWNETVNEYIYDNNTGRTVAYYKTKYDSVCQEGSCLISKNFDIDISQGFKYQEIIAKAFTSYSLINVDVEGIASLKVFGAQTCSSYTNTSGGISDDAFIYYDQKDYNDLFCGLTDATISSHGCGVTSMAMVISNLTNEVISPVETMNEATNTGTCGDYGTSVSYFYNASDNHGLTYEVLTNDYDGAQNVLNALRKGGLVIANVNSNSPFTTGGHYIVIRKVDLEGNIYVADPNHHELFYEKYTVDEFIDNNYLGSGGWIAFYGSKSEQYVATITPTGELGVSTGYLGNPIDSKDLTKSFSNEGNANYFPKYKNGGCHGGIDLPVATGTTVYAMDGGKVIKTGSYSGNCYQKCGTGQSYGISVTIDHGNGYVSVYAHFSKRLVEVGDLVSKGQLIGYSGNTGNSSGPHLHLELQKTDLLTENTRSVAKCQQGKGLLNPARYINTNTTYVGQIK